MRPAAPLVLAILAGACRAEVDDLEGIFYDGDGRLVHCAVNLDSVESVSIALLVERLGMLSSDRVREICAAVEVAVACDK